MKFKNMVQMGLLTMLTLGLSLGCMYAMPTRYVKEDGSVALKLAMDAKLAIRQDINRVELNTDLYEQGQDQAMVIMAAASAIGIPGAGIWGMRRKRDEDLSPEEMMDWYEEMREEFANEFGVKINNA